MTIFIPYFCQDQRPKTSFIAPNHFEAALQALLCPFQVLEDIREFQWDQQRFSEK